METWKLLAVVIPFIVLVYSVQGISFTLDRENWISKNWQVSVPDVIGRYMGLRGNFTEGFGSSVQLKCDKYWFKFSVDYKDFKLQMQLIYTNYIKQHNVFVFLLQMKKKTVFLCLIC